MLAWTRRPAGLHEAGATPCALPPTPALHAQVASTAICTALFVGVGLGSLYLFGTDVQEDVMENYAYRRVGCWGCACRGVGGLWRPRSVRFQRARRGLPPARARPP